MDEVGAYVPLASSAESAGSSAPTLTEEDLPCNRLALSVHLALDKNRDASAFDTPQEGFAVYAAFSEAALAFAAEGKLDAQQVGALHKLLKRTLEEELGACVRSVPLHSHLKTKGNRKRQRGSSGGAWCLKGSLVSYHREGKRMQMIIQNASLQTDGLVLPSDQLLVTSLDSS